MNKLNNIYNADCMDIMKEFEDKKFDLAIVDPPYGINAPAMPMGTNRKRTGTGYPGVSTATRLKPTTRLNHGRGKLKDRFLNIIACIEMDLEYLAIEKNIDYYQSSLSRVAKENIKLKLAL